MENFSKDNNRIDGYNLYCKDCVKSKREEYKAKNPVDPLISTLGRLKFRAKKLGLPFDLTVDDIIIPEFCPVLGLKLERNIGIPNHNSPSVDRFDNDKGYTKDNIRIISSRANTLKNDSTIAELEAILNYMKIHK